MEEMFMRLFNTKTNYSGAHSLIKTDFNSIIV